MASFYEKLAAKLQEGRVAAGTADPPSIKSGGDPVSYNAAGMKTGQQQPQPATAGATNAAPKDPPAEAPQPDGTDPLLVDVYQSETRMAVFVQVPGVAPEDLELTANEEENTLLIQAAQKRPNLGPQPGEDTAKSRFVKKEAKWDNLYRKVYLPEPFDAGQADSYIEHGVLVVVLPIKKPGTGKKLSVRELNEEAKEKEGQKK